MRKKLIYYHQTDDNSVRYACHPAEVYPNHLSIELPWETVNIPSSFDLSRRIMGDYLPVTVDREYTRLFPQPMPRETPSMQFREDFMRHYDAVLKRLKKIVFDLKEQNNRVKRAYETGEPLDRYIKIYEQFDANHKMVGREHKIYKINIASQGKPLILPVNLGGYSKALPAYLDSGAEIGLISRELLYRVNSTPAGYARIAGIGSEGKSQRISLVEIPLKIKFLDPIILLAGIFPVRGLTGTDLLLGQIEMDYIIEKRSSLLEEARGGR